METKKENKAAIILLQLELIDNINTMLDMSKKDNDSLGVRQYEHLKKQYVENLFKMLEENYQIPIPTLGKKAA